MFLQLLKMKNYLSILACFLHLVICSVVEKKSHYRAAIFEHSSHDAGDLDENLKMNLRTYELVARVASENGADILIYPEDGLYPAENFTRHNSILFSEIIPDPKTEIVNPCEQTETFFSRPVLSKLSCLAKQNKIYLVANMVELDKCSLIEPCNDVKGTEFCKNDCPEDGFSVYNTNVVFDREGTLIARYRKRHRFLEYDKDIPKVREDIFFDTDFGKFTTVVCFDLVYNESTLAVEKSGVKNLAYPTYWYDHFPLLYFAAAFQQSWAIENNMNLLAANGHTVGTGSVGSGIYSGAKGALVYTHSSDSHSRLLVSNVPKVPSPDFSDTDVKRFIIDGADVIEEKEEKLDAFKDDVCLTEFLGPPEDIERDYRCSKMNLIGHQYTKLDKQEDKVEICSNDICCSISYKAKTWNEEYVFGAFNDIQHFKGVFGFSTELCFLLRCDTLDSGECQRFVIKSETVFDYVELKGNYSAKYILPYAIDSGLRLTDRNQFKIDGNRYISYENQNKNSSLLYLALYGRLYEKDFDTLNGF